ncbi:MAG TPA: hypothetical protein VM452_17765 [Caulifigura sp.]|nr:hypothetical protein [Caulifigura sp.]
MLKLRTSTPTRLRPRRHDVGAALMLRFRQNGVAVPGNHSRFRLRTVDSLHAVMLTMICFSAAMLLNDDWRGRLRLAADSGVDQARPAVQTSVAANRVAPDAPELTAAVPSTVVRLSLIEDDPEGTLIARPAPPADEVRVAEEKPAVSPPPSSTSQAARQPLRAALHLGDEAMRSARW